jgi:hypothetical protein
MKVKNARGNGNTVVEDVAESRERSRGHARSMRNGSLSIGGLIAAPARCHGTSPRFGADF